MKQDPNLFDAFLRVDSKQAPASNDAPVAPKRIANPAWLLGGAGSALLVVVFFAGYYLGGGGNREALASAGTANDPGGQKPGSAVTEIDGGAPGGGENGGSALATSPNSDFPPVSGRSGLYNAENRFTVLAITYTDQLTFEKRALEVAEYLREQGLPAFDPVANGKNIEVLVGAAPTRSELSMIASRLRGTKGPNGNSYDFESAIVDNIDNHIDR